MTSKPYLMVDPVGDQIAPLSARAFKMIKAPKSRVMARNCVALFLSPKGSVWRIADIKLTAFGGVKTWLGKSAKAVYDLETVPASLNDFKTMILDARLYSRQRLGQATANWWMLSAPDIEVQSAVSGAQNFAELYDAIQFPDDENCTDHL